MSLSLSLSPSLTNTSLLGLVGGVAPVPVAEPDGFAFTGPYQPTIFRSGSGTDSTFTTDYDPAARKALITPVNTYHVSLTSGNNNNDGLSAGSPVRSLDLAMAMANASGAAAKIIYEAAPLGSPRPIYRLTNTQPRSGQASLNATYGDSFSGTNRPAVPLIIEPSVPDGLGDSVVNVALPAFAATADPNIFVANLLLPNCVVDYLNQDTYGAPRRLAVLPTASAADPNAPWPEMNALWSLFSNLPERGGGTYNLGVVYLSGGQTFIRTFDNRNPNGDANIVPLSTVAAGAIWDAITGNRVAYAEGMGFGGGAVAALIARGQNGFRFRADFVRCRWVGSNGAGALLITAAGSNANDGVDVVAYQCAANGGNLDGFNAKFKTTLITIDCIGDWNGWTTSTTNNGLTMHETAINIDVNGSYRNNQDRSVHHVHDGLSWHLGTESGTRRGADGTDISIAFAINGAGNSGTRQMWVDTPKLFSGPNGAPQHNYGVWAGSIIHHANAAVTPGPNPATWLGTFAPYTSGTPPPAPSAPTESPVTFGGEDVTHEGEPVVF